MQVLCVQTAKRMQNVFAFRLQNVAGASLVVGLRGILSITHDSRMRKCLPVLRICSCKGLKGMVQCGNNEKRWLSSQPMDRQSAGKVKGDEAPDDEHNQAGAYPPVWKGNCLGGCLCSRFNGSVAVMGCPAQLERRRGRHALERSVCSAALNAEPEGNHAKPRREQVT